MEGRRRDSATSIVASKDVVGAASPMAPTGFDDLIKKDEGMVESSSSNSSIFLRSISSFMRQSETDDDSSNQSVMKCNKKLCKF